MDSRSGQLDSHSGLDPESPALPSVSQVKAAMERLPEPYGLILDLVLIEGLDYGEIADLTGKKETTLRSLYSRGRSKLIDMLNHKI